MSSSDQVNGIAPVSLNLLRAVAFTALLTLGGCGFQPLYAERPGGGSAQDDLAAITIETQDTRLGQEIYNGLVFAFTGGGAPAPARYYLDLTISRALSDVGILEISGTPKTENLKVTVSFRLIDRASNEKLLEGQTFAEASFDRSNQRFANLRAERDAENRAARVIAADIRTRIAAYFASSRQ